MATTSFQFAVATHIMASLGFHYGEAMTSAALSESVNAEPTFVRKTVSKLAKAGLITTSRGKGGFCALALPPERISLKDIYLASEAPAAFAVHNYPVEEACPVSSNIKPFLSDIQAETQASVEKTLAKVSLSSIISNIRTRAKSKRIPRASVKAVALRK